MKDAAAALRYELAAQIKQQLAFAGEWRAHAEPLVRRESALRCLIALRVTRRRACKLFAFDRGVLTEGPVVQTRTFQAQLAAWLPTPASIDPSLESDILRMEQTWLATRLFLADERDDWTIVWLADRSPSDATAELSAAIEQLLAKPPQSEPQPPARGD
jgi:hypothetical protein